MTTRPVPESLTHQHMLAALIAERRSLPDGLRQVDVLDAGCGTGDMIAFLHTTFEALSLVTDWRFSGFDVVDSLSNRAEFPASTIEALRRSAPDTDWTSRIRASRMADTWPFDDASFEFVVSNQVLEHVRDLDAFLRETRRVLRPSGVAVNLFPLRNALFEGHVLVPFAAQVSGHEQRRLLVRVGHRLGLGQRSHRERDSAGSLHAADYVHFATHYRTWRQIVGAAKRAGLRVSYRYTAGLYGQKLRQLTRRPLKDSYRRERSAIFDWLLFTFLRHAGSVCVVFERPADDTKWG